MSDLRDCVLIVDDEFLIAESLCMHFEEMGMAVCGTAATAADAIALARQHRPRLVLMDMRLRGELDGVDAALAIHATVGCKVIFITGSREPATVERIRLDHASSVLFKPFSGTGLRSAVAAALAGDPARRKS
jgi:DNA-binding NarL/FixJ family response regulator